jgi:hypothetical protein
VKKGKQRKYSRDDEKLNMRRSLLISKESENPLGRVV